MRQGQIEERDGRAKVLRRVRIISCIHCTVSMAATHGARARGCRKLHFRAEYSGARGFVPPASAAGGRATACALSGAPRAQLPGPKDCAPRSCRAATHDTPLWAAVSIYPQRSLWINRRYSGRQERVCGPDSPLAGAVSFRQ